MKDTLFRLMIFFIALLVIGQGALVVSAHGREVELEISSLIPDSSQPLTRLYRVIATYEDGDRVDDAEITLVAVREEGGQTLGPIAFYPLGEAGVYAAEINYDRFGNWNITVTVTEPGEGEIEFTDAVLPASTSSSTEATDSEVADSAIPERFAFLFEFNVQDTINIVFRFVHSLAGVAWFGLIAVIFIAHRFMEPQAEYKALLKLRSLFRAVAIGALIILLGSGVYNAIFDAPIRSPGVFDLQTMLAIPFGNAYMLAFAGKVIAYVVLAITTVLLDRRLHKLPENKNDEIAAPIEMIQSISRVATVAAITGLFLIVDVAILIYMHYISHLSIVIPTS